MNKEEIKEKMEELTNKMKDLEAKTKDAIDTAKIKGLYAKDKLDEMMEDAKNNMVAAQENFRIFSQRAKSKASSELIKAQMNIDVAKKELEAKKEAHNKASMESYIEELADYAEACIELSILASQEAKLAAIEASVAQQEYEEKYGKQD